MQGIGPDAAKAIPDLVGLLGRKDTDQMVLRTIETWGPAASAALPALKREYDQADTKYRGSVQNRQAELIYTIKK